MRNSRPLRVALTGGIATGKSHCLAHFSDLGVPVVDADVLAREVLTAGTPGLSAVRERFGETVFGRDGQLDRAALARVVFQDDRARHDLEAIVHPAVYERIERWFDGVDAKDHPIAIADVPLLYETHHEKDFDRVVVAACSPADQLQRVMHRDGLSGDAARQRIAAQLPIEDKRRRADSVIDTSGSPEETKRQVRDLWDQLKKMSPRRDT